MSKKSTNTNAQTSTTSAKRTTSSESAKAKARKRVADNLRAGIADAVAVVDANTSADAVTLGNAQTTTQASDVDASSSTSANPDTSADESANVDAVDASAANANADTSANANAVPSLDDIANASAVAVASAAQAASAKTKAASAPRVTRVTQQAQLHRAIVGVDALWTARLLYRSKRRMRLANVDVSSFPSAFIATSIADDANDEQRASANAQNERAKTWDAAMLSVIVESNFLMGNKTPAIVAFLTEMSYDASKTTVKRAASGEKKTTTSARKSTTVVVETPEQVNIRKGEEFAANMCENQGVERALANLTKASKALDKKNKSDADYATRRAQYDAALAYVARKQAAQAA